MIPSRRQFKKWTLPSRLTFYSFLIGLLSIIIAFVFGIIPFFHSSDYEEPNFDALKRDLLYMTSEEGEELRNKYKHGFVIFGLYNDLRIFIIDTSYSQMNIDWNGVHVRTDSIKTFFVFESIVHTSMNARIENISFEIPTIQDRPQILLPTANTILATELVNSYQYGLVMLLGFVNPADLPLFSEYFEWFMFLEDYGFDPHDFVQRQP